jgi:hypothetical protein
MEILIPRMDWNRNYKVAVLKLDMAATLSHLVNTTLLQSSERDSWFQHKQLRHIPE